MAQVASLGIGRERMPDVLYGMAQRLRTRFMQLQTARDNRHVLLDDKVALDHVPRAHRLQDRPECVIESQSMRRASACRDRHDGAAC